jgi:hypothetical protein
MTDIADMQQTVPRFLLLVNSGYSRVLAVRMARGGRSQAPWPQNVLLGLRSAAPAALIPALFELSLRFGYPSLALHSLRAISWVAALTVVDLLGLLCAWRGWSLFARSAPSVDDLMAKSAAREEISSWLAKAMSWRRQGLLSVLFGLIACLLLRIAEPEIRTQLEINFPSYVAVAWTGMIGGNCVYWLVALSDLVRRILRLPDLSLIWHSPASTPAIAQLSGGFAFMTMATLAAFVCVEVLAVRSAAYGQSNVLTSLTTVIPVLAGVGALVVGILPHWWLYSAVRDGRRAALRALLPLAGDRVPTTTEQAALVRDNVSLYREVETSPSLPFSTAAMVQYAAAVLGTLVAFLLGT